MWKILFVRVRTQIGTGLVFGVTCLRFRVTESRGQHELSMLRLLQTPLRDRVVRTVSMLAIETR